MTDWGAAPWRIGTIPPRAELPARCDVAVIGAGLLGLSAAWHLARRGVAPVVLETGRIGAGASGHTGALVLEGTAQGPLPGADRCLETMIDVVDALGDDCGLHLPGCDLLEHRDTLGDATPRWHDDGRLLCVADVEAGGRVDVGALLGRLAEGALDAGATVLEDTRVLRLEPDRIVTARGDLRAGRVVLAVNAWTATLVPLPVRFGVALTLALATSPVPAAVLDAVDLAHGRPFYTLDLPYLWGRVLADGRLVFGAGLVWARDGRPESVEVSHPEAVAAFARLETRVRGLHPALDGVAIDARWGGPIAFPKGRAPLLGAHPDLPHVLVAGGCSGHGVALSVQMGRLLCAAVTDGAALPAWGALRPG